MSIHEVFPHRHRIPVELHTYFHNLVAIGFVGQGIAFAVDLVKGLLSGAVHFQLEHVGGVGHLHHKIYATACTFHLCAGVYVQHVEDEPESVFVEAFVILHFRQFFLESFHLGDAGQKGFQLLHGRINILLVQRTPKPERKAICGSPLQSCVSGN